MNARYLQAARFRRLIVRPALDVPFRRKLHDVDEFVQLLLRRPLTLTGSAAAYSHTCHDAR